MLFDESNSCMSIDSSSRSSLQSSSQKSAFLERSWFEEVEAAEAEIMDIKNEAKIKFEIKIQDNSTTDKIVLQPVKHEPSADCELNIDDSARDAVMQESIKLEPIEQQTQEKFGLMQPVKNELFLEQPKEEKFDLSTITNTVLKRPVKHESSADREIVVEFLEQSNEEKFERLLKDEKIKTPFKRRMSGNSNDSRSNSPLSFLTTDGSTGSISLSKKTRIEGNAQSRTSSRSTSSTGSFRNEQETDEEILSRRQKQIDYGKNTLGYDNYSKQFKRSERSKEHPWTPTKTNKYSRRAWDGLVKIWRKKLHVFDPSSTKEAEGDSGEAESDGEHNNILQ